MCATAGVGGSLSSTRYHNIYIDGAVCFWTSSIIQGTPILRSPTACRKVLDVLDECRVRHGVKLVGYVLMPDHLHLAVWSESASSVQTFLKDFLRRTSTVIAGLVARAAERGDPQAQEWLTRFRDRARQKARVRVWKERGRAFPVTKENDLRQKLNYMHKNSVRRGTTELLPRSLSHDSVPARHVHVNEHVLGVVVEHRRRDVAVVNG